MEPLKDFYFDSSKNNTIKQQEKKTTKTTTTNATSNDSSNNVDEIDLKAWILLFTLQATIHLKSFPPL